MLSEKAEIACAVILAQALTCRGFWTGSLKVCASLASLSDFLGSHCELRGFCWWFVMFQINAFRMRIKQVGFIVPSL